MRIPGNMFLPAVSIMLSVLHLSKCITFLSREDSYAEYPPWEAKTSGRLEFEFKTFNPWSLLLYAEEVSDLPNGQKSFITLSLRHGSLRLVVQMGGDDFRSKRTLDNFGVNLNDLRWHKVVIIRDKNKTILSLDGRSWDLINEGKLLHLPVNSSLFVGGVHREILHKVVSARIKQNQIPRYIEHSFFN